MAIKPVARMTTPIATPTQPPTESLSPAPSLLAVRESIVARDSESSLASLSGGAAV